MMVLERELASIQTLEWSWTSCTSLPRHGTTIYYCNVGILGKERALSRLVLSWRSVYMWDLMVEKEGHQVEHLLQGNVLCHPSA